MRYQGLLLNHTKMQKDRAKKRLTTYTYIHTVKGLCSFACLCHQLMQLKVNGAFQCMDKFTFIHATSSTATNLANLWFYCIFHKFSFTLNFLFAGLSGSSFTDFTTFCLVSSHNFPITFYFYFHWYLASPV